MIAKTVLQGEKVSLRPVEERDLPLTLRWSNDREVRHWLHGSDRPDDTPESKRKWYEQMQVDPARVGWIIEGPDGIAIGWAALQGIDDTHGRAELAITIGEKAYWGRGYGTDAVRQLLSYAFVQMGLRRVHLITDEDNARGIRCYEKCGFVREGLLRAHRLRHGQPLNMIVMGVLREEWGRE